MSVTGSKLEQVINKELGRFGYHFKDGYVVAKESHQHIPRKKHWWHDGPTYDTWKYDVMFRMNINSSCEHHHSVTVYYSDKFPKARAQGFIHSIEECCPVTIDWDVKYVLDTEPGDCIMTNEPFPEY